VVDDEANAGVVDAETEAGVGGDDDVLQSNKCRKRVSIQSFLRRELGGKREEVERKGETHDFLRLPRFLYTELLRVLDVGVV
jgi:hypothetical protein